MGSANLPALHRLNFRLADKCEADIETLCGEECSLFMGQSCGGRVLRCLTEKQDQVKSEECAAEIFYFEKMEVNDFRNDVLLAEACRSDVDRFCKTVQPGEGPSPVPQLAGWSINLNTQTHR